MTKALLLDLDDTLLDDLAATRQGLAGFVAAHGERLPPADFETHLARWRALMQKYWLLHERREIGFLEQRRCRVREFLGQTLTDAEADAAFVPYLQAYEAGWQLVPEATAFLEQTAHLPRVIVTNGGRALQVRKLAATGLDQHISVMLTPDDTGFCKPHPAMFLAAVEMVGVTPQDCLMIGDDERRDIEPARQLGMRCFQVIPGNADSGLLNALRQHLA